MIEFFRSLFGNAGAFVVDSYNAIASFVDFVPGWVGPILLAILAIIVVRVVINVL